MLMLSSGKMGRMVPAMGVIRTEQVVELSPTFFSPVRGCCESSIRGPKRGKLILRPRNLPLQIISQVLDCTLADPALKAAVPAPYRSRQRALPGLRDGGVRSGASLPAVLRLEASGCRLRHHLGAVPRRPGHV